MGAERWTALADVLGRRKPQAIVQLQASFPEYARELAGSRVLGPVPATPATTAGLPHGRVKLAEELLDEASAALRADLSETQLAVARRLRAISWLRLTASLVAAASSAGVIALRDKGADQVELVSASVAFIAATIAALSTLIEEFAGGPGALRAIHNSLAEQARALAAAEGEGRIARIMRDDTALISAVRALDLVAGEVRFVRSKVGLPLYRPT